jgi:uncharacterized DUF497 family protein
MGFDWDDENITHLARHDVTPQEFEQAFRNEPLRLYRTLHHRERRYAALGKTDGGRLLLFIYTKRGRKTRAITAHTAPRKLRKFYAGQKSTQR